MLDDAASRLEVNAFQKQDDYYAAVDLGSNSFHMVIVRVLAGSVQTIGKHKQKVRLAAGLSDTNLLSEDAIVRGLNCLTNFAEKLQDIHPNNIKIVATATLRLATNASDFLTRAESILNQKVNVISGEEEARQIYLGVAYTSANQGNSLVIDIGGASTEVIVGRDLQPMHLVSMDMGCVTFMEGFFPKGALTKRNFDNACQAASIIIEKHKDTFLCFDWEKCLGASGTPQAVTQILVKRGINDAIRLSYLLHLKDECIEQGQVADLKIDGLVPSRQAIFPSGLAILIALFEKLNIENMQIAGGALREGIIYGMLDNYHKSDRRTQGLNQLISRFHIDPSHSQRAKEVAINLCNQLCEQNNFCNYDTHGVVAAAAALHELGLHVGYKQYHEHGAYILNHVEITGYTSLQRMMIRDLVSMHRQPINLTAINQYTSELQDVLVSCLRILRIAIVLIGRRKKTAIPSCRLVTHANEWELQLAQDIKTKHPLIYTELVHEAWMQHKAGWKLTLSTYDGVQLDTTIKSEWND